MSELEKCMDALEAIGRKTVSKSLNGLSPRDARARAIAAASKTPDGAILAKRIHQLQHSQAVRKAAGEPDEDAESEFRLRAELRQIQEREKEIQEELRELTSKSLDDDDWSSQFSEA